MSNKRTSRWDALAGWEMQALDELFQSFGPMRNYNPDVQKLALEIAAAMERRNIPRFAPSCSRANGD